MNHPQKVITSTPRTQTPNLQAVDGNFIPINTGAQVNPNRLRIHISDKMLRFLGAAAVATTLIGIGGFVKERVADHTAAMTEDHKSKVQEEVATRDGVRIKVKEGQNPTTLAEGAVDAQGNRVNEQELASFLGAQGINADGSLGVNQGVEYPEGIQPTTTTTPDQG